LKESVIFSTETGQILAVDRDLKTITECGFKLGCQSEMLTGGVKRTECCCSFTDFCNSKRLNYQKRFFLDWPEDSNRFRLIIHIWHYSYYRQTRAITFQRTAWNIFISQCKSVKYWLNYLKRRVFKRQKPIFVLLFVSHSNLNEKWWTPTLKTVFFNG